MKKNLPVTEKEIPFPEGAEIVSATDLKGVITDCNQAFIDISGVSRISRFQCHLWRSWVGRLIDFHGLGHVALPLNSVEKSCKVARIRAISSSHSTSLIVSGGAIRNQSPYFPPAVFRE